MRKVLTLLCVCMCLNAHAQKIELAAIDSMMRLLPKRKDDTNKVNILYELSWNYYVLNKPDSGIKYGEYIRELSTRLNWQTGIAHSGNMLGMNYLLKHNMDSSLAYFSEALNVWEKMGRKDRVRMIAGNIGNVYSEMGDKPNALKYYIKALKIAEQTGDRSAMANLTGAIGTVYEGTGDYDKAIEYYLMAMKMYGELKHPDHWDQRDEANLAQNLAVGYQRQDHLSKAQEYNSIALKKAEVLEDTDMQANIYGNMSLVAAKQHSYVKAVENGQISLNMATTRKHTAWALYEIGNAMLSLAVDTAGSGITVLQDERTPSKLIPDSKEARVQAAVNYLSRSLDTIRDMPAMSELLRFVYHDLTVCYELQRNYKDALEYFQRYNAIMDSISSKETGKKIVQQQMQYEFDKKEAVANTELLKQKREKQFLIGGGVLMLLITGGSIYFLIYTRRAKKLVEEQKNRAERSERFKQQFLANMSHEIRTPMNAVLGMTNLALDNPLTPKVSNYLTAVKKSSENLLVIINDVLDLSKLEAGKMDLEKIPFRLSEQVRQVYDTMHFKAEEKGLILLTKINKDVPDVLMGDPSRLNQVLINLCGNAIKFTEKGTVRIVVEQVTNLTPALSKVDGDVTATLCFKVIDSGIGIPADKLDKLFESFNQADASTARKYGGTGLGLSISKTLVELQGGRMEVKSTEGEGSEFSFVIEYDVADEKAMLEVATGSKAHPAWLQGIRILVAEDNEYNQVVVKDTLQNLIRDVKVDLADNGKIAIEKLQANDYDVILMDAQMPEMTGLEASVYIRKNMQGRKQGIPIIALTASVLNTDLSKCTDAGMNAYVPKPFKREELLNTLARFYKNEQGKEIEKKVADADERIAGTEQTTGNVTDLSFLHDFCDGDRERMKKYIDIYLKVTPGNLEKIGIALNNKDYAVLAKMVHAMKAHLNYMGMKPTRELAEKIEQYALEEIDLTDLPQMIAQLQKDWERSRAELG